MFSKFMKNGLFLKEFDLQKRTPPPSPTPSYGTFLPKVSVAFVATLNIIYTIDLLFIMFFS